MKSKNLFFLATALSVSASAIAQPTLNKSNFAPVIGDSTQYYMISGYSGNEGPSGANQNWDFSNVGNGAERNFNYISCAASPDCANNPGTTVVMKGSDGSYIYYIVDNNKMAIKGIGNEAQGQSAIFHYSDPEDVMHFPFTFNNTYSDNTACSASLSSGVEISRSGTTTVTADAYGTLKTPKGTFQNTLRIYMHQVYEDIMTVSGSSQVLNYDTKIYSWYQPGIHDILLTISTVSVNGGAPLMTLQYSNAPQTTSISDLENSKKNLEIFPNPATQYTNIKLTKPNDAIQNIKVVNVLGQEVAEYSAKTLKQKSNGVYSMDLNAVSSGIYWLQVQTKQGNFSQKLQVIK